MYLIITPFFPSSESFRGPFILDQVKAIERTGKYKVSVWKPKPWHKRIKNYTYENIKVNYFNVYEFPSDIFPGLFNKLTFRSFRQKIKKEGIDEREIKVVHCHVTKTGFIANALKKRNPGIKTILQHHGFDVLNLTNGVLSKYQWHQKWVKNYGINICNKIDLHLCVSAKTLEYLENFSEIKNMESYVLYNGVDTKKFFPVNGLKDINYFTIGCIGNFWKIKDQITLIKAAEMLILSGTVNIRVLLIGSGELFDTCFEYVRTHNLERYFEFRFEIPHNDLCEFYNKLDLFVLPSYYEALGCVYIESNACGVPFIGVENQGIEELILPINRQYQLMEPRNIDDLVKKIRYFISQIHFKSELIQNMDIDVVVEDYLNFLKK